MSRVALFGLLALLLGGIALSGEPDPVRLAAAQMGTLMREPAEFPSEGDWRARLDAGDRVEIGGQDAEVLARDGDRVTLRVANRSEVVRSVGEVERLVAWRPLWRVLLEGPCAHPTDDGTVELWVRGYRMDLTRTAWKDIRLNARVFESVVRSLRSVASEQGIEFEIVERTSPTFPGLVMFASHDASSLSVEFTDPEGTSVSATRAWTPPGRETLLPSILAIFAAVLFRRPLLALFCGVLTAAFVQARHEGSGWLGGLWQAPFAIVPGQLARTLGEPSHQVIVGFLVAMLAMVGVVRGAGGMQGLMMLLARWATNARRSQIVTYVMGMVVFFDHYANAVLVGATMRPISDRFRVSREKLAYLVDSTSAPVAGLSLFSTWIAFEVSAFQPHLPDAGMGLHQGYEVFLRTLPFRFYSLFTLLLVGLIVLSGRDFGPMLRAERRARAGELLRKGARLISPTSAAAAAQVASIARPRARTLIRPLAVFVGVTLASTLLRGGLVSNLESGPTLGALQTALLCGCGPTALLHGSLASLVTAVVEAWLCGARRSILRSAWNSVRSVGTVLALLCLAWLFGALCLRVGTASFLSVMIQEGPNPLLLPVILFALSAAVAFATGSSWSTMTILLPLVVGIAYEAGPNTPVGAELLVVIAIGSVLEGAIFGDHCSPIADSTIMSSIATQSDHVDHVRTQAPYALLAMAVALLCGYFPVVFLGLSPLSSLALGAAAIVGCLLAWGRRVPEAPAAPSSIESPGRVEPAGPSDRLAA